jgi:hypothetical protein
MLEDPWLFIWHLHLLLTAIHFLTWVSSYGFVGGSGPASITVMGWGGGERGMLGEERQEGGEGGEQGDGKAQGRGQQQQQAHRPE